MGNFFCFVLFRRLVIVNKIVDSEHHQQQEIGDRAGNQCVDQDVKQRCERDEPDFRGAGKLFETADIADAGAKVAQQVKPDCCQRDRHARNGIIMVQQRAYDDHYHNNLNQGFGGYFHVRNFPGRQWVEFPARLSFRQRNVGVKNIERQSYNKNLFIALSK